jgi:phage tail-like protein
MSIRSITRLLVILAVITGIGHTTTLAQDREDPLLSFAFSLELDGVVLGYFTEVSGIGSETEVIEQRVVNEQGQELILKVPGRLKINNITLKRGITSNMSVWTWRKQVEDGKIEEATRNATLTMLDQALNTVAQWNLLNCWPADLSFTYSPDPVTALEELVIVCETYERVQ